MSVEIPLTIFLGLFVAALIFFIAHAATNMYFVSRFGAFDSRNVVVAVIFLLYAATIVVATLLYLLPVDWSGSLHIALPNFSSTPTPEIL